MALDLLTKGKINGTRLPFWNENTVIRCQFTDKNSKMTHGYMYVESDKGLVPWIPTYPEMLSDKWQIVDNI